MNVERLPREEKSYPILVHSLYNQESGDNSQSNEVSVHCTGLIFSLFVWALGTSQA